MRPPNRKERARARSLSIFDGGNVPIKLVSMNGGRRNFLKNLEKIREADDGGIYYPKDAFFSAANSETEFYSDSDESYCDDDENVRGAGASDEDLRGLMVQIRRTMEIDLRNVGNGRNNSNLNKTNLQRAIKDTLSSNVLLDDRSVERLALMLTDDRSNRSTALANNRNTNSAKNVNKAPARTAPLMLKDKKQNNIPDLTTVLAFIREYAQVQSRGTHF